MGTTLTGTTPQDTYDSLIKVTDNGPLSGTAKYLSDGLGNDSALALSTTAVGIGTNTPTRELDVVGTIKASSSVVVGLLQLQSNFLWGQGSGIRFRVDTPSQGGVAVNTTPISNVTTLIRGWGTTSATTALLVQNSAGTNLLNVRDDGNIGIFSSRIFDGTNTDKSFYIVGNVNVVSNFQAVSLRVWNGSAYASGLEVLGDGAESRVGIGTTAPHASAKLQLDSTAKGFLPPRMTTTQKNAIATPAEGLVVYDTTLAKLCVYTTAWETITSL
jgi:hypothetical protein